MLNSVSSAVVGDYSQKKYTDQLYIMSMAEFSPVFATISPVKPGFCPRNNFRFEIKANCFWSQHPQFSQFALDIGHQRQVDTGAGLVPSLVQDRMSELHK